MQARCFQVKSGFPVIAEITRCHTFTKEINHASTCSQYFNENFYCKNCLRVFSAMTGKKALASFLVQTSLGARNKSAQHFLSIELAFSGENNFYSGKC